MLFPELTCTAQYTRTLICCCSCPGFLGGSRSFSSLLDIHETGFANNSKLCSGGWFMDTILAPRWHDPLPVEDLAGPESCIQEHHRRWCCGHSKKPPCSVKKRSSEKEGTGH